MLRFIFFCFAAALSSVLVLSQPSVAQETTSSFPKVGIMPKQEIGALDWLEKHPEFDGRGVVVAIFDTGVDPGAAGLQETTDGKPKVIAMIDGTGSGDVDTTTVKKADGNTLAGLSGRKLKLNPQWVVKDRDFHVGFKAAYEFYPDELVPRLKRVRRKAFDKKQAALETKLRRQLNAWDAKRPNPKDAQKKARDEMKTRLDVLVAAGKSYQDPGPIFDCVVFHDGKAWRAVVDTDADGDLTDEKAMTNYRDELQWSTFGDGAELNFGVNIFDKGNRLSIVADGHPHGTHVAGIVAGNFPEQPELNGVAPGAQIVSIKIGDTRLGGMETAAGLERGIIRTIQDKCDLINMSFGEPTRTPNSGKIAELCADAVNNHGVIFVSSAGNAGPALSTAGAPGATTSAIIGVGAYVSNEMARAEYSIREEIAEGPYTFTSLGPTFDGDMGVDISAPGGAIAPIPNWTLNRSMQMNGTSMASPNAVGAIALMLSAAKANDIPFTPYSVRKAIQNTARNVEKSEVFAEGPGLIQVPAAYEHLAKYATMMGEELHFDVRVTSGHNARGIYLREAHEVARPANHTINVKPVFRDEDDNARKLAFEMRVTLRTTEPWVKSGDSMFMNSSGKRCRIEVDPTGLEPGVHYAEVQGLDADNEARGPLFRLPVTVIIPERVTAETDYELGGKQKFNPGQIMRRFITVPHGATWMDVELSRDGGEGSRLIVLHTLQKLEGWSNEDGEHQSYNLLSPDAEKIESIPVVGGRTVELCLTQYWWSLGDTELNYEVTFYGVEPDDRLIELNAGDKPRRVLVRAPLRKTTIAPSASLSTHRQIIHPKDATIKPLGAERDLLPDGRQFYELQVTYSFSQPKAGTVTPRLPLTDDLLYDGTIGPHLWQLYDANKRLIRTDDIWPDDAGPLRLEKGQHTLKVWIRSTKQSDLEAAKTMVLHLDRPIGPISVGCYADRPHADAGSPKFSSATLQVGQVLPIYVAAPSPSKLPTGFADGDLLLGTISYAKADPLREGEGKRPSGYEIAVSGKKKAASGGTPAASKGEKKPKKQQLADELFELRIKQLKSLGEKDTKLFEQIYAALLKEKPKHMPVLLAKLHRLDSEAKRKEQLQAVVDAADTVLAEIDVDALATHFGTNVSDDEEAKKVHAELTKQRDILTDTLYRKGRALGYMELPDVIEKHPITDKQAHDKAFEDTFAALAKWVDTTETKYSLLHIRKERRKDRQGKALELLKKRMDDASPTQLLDKKRRDMYEELGWEHLRENAADWMLRKFPSAYQPF